MEKCFSPDPLIDKVAAAHQVQKLALGSLWWVSGEIWRSADQSRVLDPLQTLGVEIVLAGTENMEQPLQSFDPKSGQITVPAPVPQKTGGRAFLTKIFGKNKVDTNEHLALAADTTPPPVPGIIDGNPCYRYIIRRGEKGNAHVRVMCDQAPPEFVIFRLENTKLYLRFTHLESFWSAVEQTDVPFSSEAKLTLDP